MGSLLRRPVSIRRPLASATASLRRGVPARARHGTELLPQLLDFEGTVQLAQTLESAPLPALPATPPAEAIARAKRRLAAIERDARQPLLEGAQALTADRVARVLASNGAPGLRARKMIASAATELFTPLQARALRRITSLRQLIADVRQELAPTIIASSPAGARLEQLDGALTAATAARSDALFARAVTSMGDSFAADLESAVRALPDPCDAIPAAEWAAPRGVVAEHVARIEGLVLAAFFHERARVDMLAHSALGERLA